MEPKKTSKKKPIPVFRLVIDPNEEFDGINAISFVEQPAIETNFLAFSEEKEALKFAITDNEQQVILGPVLVPNKLIYRKDFQGNEEANVYFSPEDVELLVQKFFKKKNENNITLEHSVILSEGAYLFSAFISDKENGINPKQFEDLPDSTFFVAYKVDSPELWSMIKEGQFNGFSLEGFFDSIQVKQSENLSEIEILDRILEALQEIE
jgi:Putative phage serine protease XkdF